MAVSILFPDGSIRDVPGQLIARSGDHERTIPFIQIPVNSDPIWRYCQIDGRWRAIPRHRGNVTILTPNLREWWHSIAQMQDRPVDPETNVA